MQQLWIDRVNGTDIVQFIKHAFRIESVQIANWMWDLNVLQKFVKDPMKSLESNSPSCIGFWNWKYGWDSLCIMTERSYLRDRFYNVVIHVGNSGFWENMANKMGAVTVVDGKFVEMYKLAFFIYNKTKLHVQNMTVLYNSNKIFRI